MIPYYKIQVGEIDITQYVTSFSYEDCVKEDDLVSLQLMSVDLELLNSDFLKVGKEIDFQFGFLGVVTSGLKVARITDIDYNYGKSVDVTIKALDLGQLSKKSERQTVYQNKTASDIAKEIAKKYNLGTKNIENTSFRYEHLAQANKTDWELLNYLVEREKDGSFRWYIKNNEMYFGRLNLEKTSGIVLTYGVDIISFKPSLKDSQNKSDEKSIANLDPITKKVNEANVNINDAKDQTFLGKASNSTSEKRDKPKPIQKYNSNGKAI